MQITPSTPESTNYNDINETSLNLEQIQKEIDSKRYPRPQLDVDYIPPRTPIEKKLAVIWEELFQLEKVGVNDDFFQLGGHSLMAIDVITRVQQEFNVEVAMETLFSVESITLAGFARAIEEQSFQNVNTNELESALNEINNLSDEEVRRLLTDMEKN